MSQKYLWAVWCEELKKAKQLAKEDETLFKMGPYQNKVKLKDTVSSLYFRYLLTTNKLSEVADFLRDPLTLPLVRKVYELLLSRTLQLRIELARLTCQNHANFDLLLIDNSLTPPDIQYRIPKYFQDARIEKIEQQKDYIIGVLNKIKEEQAENMEEELSVTKKHMDINDWDFVRDSQNKARTLSVKLTSQETEKKVSLYSQEHDKKVSLLSENSDTTLLDLSLSLTEDATERISLTPFGKEREWNEKTIEKQKLLKEELNEQLIKWAEKVTKEYKDLKLESAQDEIRGWIDEFFRTAGQYPPYPPQETFYITNDMYGNAKKIPKDDIERDCKIKVLPLPKNISPWEYVGVDKVSGSSLITSGYWVEAKPEEKQPEQKGNKSNADSSKKLKKTSPAIKGKAKEPEGFKLNETAHYFLFTELLKKERECKERIYSDWDEELLNDAMMNLEADVRVLVDDTMRNEIQLLTEALEKDRGRKGKKKKGKGRKGKGNKGKRMKNDITADKTTEECMEELIRWGVLIPGQAVQLEEYIAENYWAESAEMSTGDIIQFIVQRFILPLSSSTVHQFVPLSSSLCIVGPEKSGKSHLAQAIATTAGATIFDLSPTVTADIYPGMKGGQMLMALVERLSRELQPSVIIVNDIDKVFYKKVPKLEKGLNPKKLAGGLLKFVKGIKEADRIMLVGTAGTPWLAQEKKLMKICQHFVNIPLSHYGHHSRIWQLYLMGFTSWVEPAALAKLSSSFQCPCFHIMETFLKGQTTTDQNYASQIVQTFLDLILTDESRYQKFMSRTPLAKAKEAMIAAENEEKNSKKKRR